MQTLLITLKREFWENHAVIVGLPLIVAALILIAAVGEQIIKSKAAQTAASVVIERQIERDLSTEERKALERGASSFEWEFGDDSAASGIDAMKIFVVVAWVAAYYYLLGALYNDRKDKSVLFWKSMPVSEHFTVLSKLGFATLVATTIAILIGWVLFLILWTFGLGFEGERTFSLQSLYGYAIAPFAAVVVGLLWGAPVFAYLAWASAAAKRSPFLLVIVPLAVLTFLEGMVFENVEIISFFFSHMPFVVLGHMTDAPGQSAFTQFMGYEWRSMLAGWVVAAGFILAAIWYRNNKFEI